jgi:acyl-CoA hydrolase
MKWMEYIAVMTASKHCRSHLITASMDSLTFKKPTLVGDILYIKGIVSAAFDHSVEVYVIVEKEDLSGAHRTLTNDGWLTLVSVDESGKPCQVPQLICATDDQKMRVADSLIRKRKRISERKMIDQLVQETLK